MTRCDEFYQRVEKDGNFCNMDRTAYHRTVEYIDFCRENNLPLGELSERAARPLIKEKNPVAKEAVIESLKRGLGKSRSPTAKQIKMQIKNIAVGKSNRGGDHKGAQKGRGSYNNLLLTAVRMGETKHHITDAVIIGIPKEVHESFSGYPKEDHRAKIMDWLKEQVDKYNIVRTYLEKKEEEK